MTHTKIAVAAVAVTATCGVLGARVETGRSMSYDVGCEQNVSGEQAAELARATHRAQVVVSAAGGAYRVTALSPRTAVGGQP